MDSQAVEKDDLNYLILLADAQVLLLYMHYVVEIVSSGYLIMQCNHPVRIQVSYIVSKAIISFQHVHLSKLR